MIIRHFKIYVAVAVLALALFALFPTSKVAAQTSAATDAVIILPFENTSNRSEYNWVGESFADALSELLNVPGLIVVSSDERELAYQRVRLPLTTIPSRATAIKLAREARATMIVLGTYKVIPAQGATGGASLQVMARVIKVNEGRLMGETMVDGNWVTRVYDLADTITALQSMHGRLAYQILYHRDKALPFSQNQFVQQATKVPQRAFEAYVKGVQTQDKETREIYFKNALRFYTDANAGAIYPQAAFELGMLYFAENNWKDAAEYFSKLQKKDAHYAEGAFYAGLAYWRLKDYSRALAALVPLTSDMPLTGIYNNTGAVSVQAAREEKKQEERARLLTQAATFLARASESSPDDPTVRFNYAYALFLSGKYAEAAEQLRPVITADPRDGQAYFLFAKSLERTGKTEAATAADDQARRYLLDYAKWQTEWQKSQTAPGVSLRLQLAFNRNNYFDFKREEKVEPGIANAGGAQDLLIKAREFYQAGRDDEALTELRRAVTVEPTNAEAYLLSGRINQRRGDQEAAIAALKTAIFWDSKQIDAHILLGRIFLERGDRAQAITYARSAMQIDPNNQEAIALQRQVDTSGK